MKNSLKQKTAALRRKHILDAAGRAFAEHGYQRATIRDVASAAGVAEGTIYNSFANKADLLLSLLDPLEERLPGVSGDVSVEPAFSSDGMEAMLERRWGALKPELLDLLRVVLSEGLVDKPVGEALLSRVLGPAIKPLEVMFESSGMPKAPLAARTAVATFLGLAIFRMLDDPVLKAEPESVPAQMAVVVTALSAYEKAS
ncbi:TetR/AcrR family transcriptional regulator [Pararhizobium antarcticum]|uniref:HTH tetR-type domain-containing protein n=1 Tax=Pararhizobium antarcticum TaxID=1798805 RepID=A0A657LK84_9HYPH|nr:helix-turn-helix domain-containing protein [Pararhizobium antarcticum]OJF90071.1 hypothetical protein AX760_24670 [Pararhizobium antarcticum]